MNTATCALYHGIMRDLYNEGEAVRTICGSVYSFLYSDFGTEITCNGKFLCEITHNAELADLLCDLSESTI